MICRGSERKRKDSWLKMKAGAESFTRTHACRSKAFFPWRLPPRPGAGPLGVKRKLPKPPVRYAAPLAHQLHPSRSCPLHSPRPRPAAPPPAAPGAPPAAREQEPTNLSYHSGPPASAALFDGPNPSWRRNYCRGEATGVASMAWV